MNKIKKEQAIKDTSSDFYKFPKIPIYTAELFKDVGASLLVSILDMYGINPYSRLVKSSVNLNSAVDQLKEDILRDLAKPSSIKAAVKKKTAKTGPTFELVLAKDEKETE
jgi:hypothetical protein